MRRLTVLQAYEARQFDLPPKFSKAERKFFFMQDSVIKEELKKIRGDINPIGLLLQYGYFKSSGKFYTSEKFWLQDIIFVEKQLGLEHKDDFSSLYADRTRRNHEIDVLKLCGYKPFSEYKDLFLELTDDLVAKQIVPRKIIFSLVDMLRDKKIEVPQYDTFATVISESFNRFEKSNIDKIDLLLTQEYKQALMQLITKNEEAYQRPLLVNLKTISQSIRPAEIKRSIHGFLIIKKLYDEVSSLIKALDLSQEATRYYANWVIKAKMTQLTGLANDSQYCLYLLAFIDHQFKMYQDTFIDIILKCVQQQLNKVESEVNHLIFERQAEKNALTDLVLQGYQKQFVSISSAREVLYSESINEIEKIEQLKKIIPKQESIIEQQQHQNADKLSEELEQDKEKKSFYYILEKLSRKLQNRISEIMKYLTFSVHNNHKDLAEAIVHYQQKNITKSSPSLFLNTSEINVIYENDSFNLSLYKSILFIHIANGIKSGVISLIKSYRYMSIESYLIKDDVWKNDYLRILEKTNLERFANVDAVLVNLAHLNHQRFYTVNANITSGMNKYVKSKKEGGFTVYTPALDKPDYESFSDLIGRERFVSILQMMSEASVMTKFTNCFTHHKVKGAHHPPSDETFLAGLFALGSNIGLSKLASTARGINYSQLTHCVNWYFSLGNLHAVNNSLVEFMNKLWLPDQFKKEKQLLHTSSDAQKRCVSVESLNANSSYKYFGNGKGSNIYMFIDERGILFYTTVFSSSERDAAYVIDGLLHSENVHSNMHSTDTHGYTDIIFAISHLLGVAFAPRLKDATTQQLVSFTKIRRDLAKNDAIILPKKVIDQDLIKTNWNTILRLLATIKLHEHQASLIIKRLNSYTGENPLQESIKEFGQIIKTAFLLEYFNDVELRQTIEKQLNKGELANKFSSAISFANNQEIMQVEREDQEVAAVCKMIIQNIIILWNYVELTKLIIRADDVLKAEILANILCGSILAWGHANLLGTYDFRNLISRNDDDISVAEVIEYKAA